MPSWRGVKEVKDAFSSKRHQVGTDTETTRSRHEAMYNARVVAQTARGIVTASPPFWPDFERNQRDTAEDARQANARGSAAPRPVQPSSQALRMEPKSSGTASPSAGNVQPRRAARPVATLPSSTSFESSQPRQYSFTSSDDRPPSSPGREKTGIPTRRPPRTKPLEASPKYVGYTRSKPSEITASRETDGFSQGEANAEIIASPATASDDGIDDAIDDAIDEDVDDDIHEGHDSRVIKWGMESPTETAEMDTSTTPPDTQRPRSTSNRQQQSFDSTEFQADRGLHEEKRLSRVEVPETDASVDAILSKKYLLALEENRELRVKSASERSKLRNELNNLKIKAANALDQLAKAEEAKKKLDADLLKLTQASQAESEKHTQEIGQLNFAHDTALGDMQDKMQEKDASIRDLQQTVRDNTQQLKNEAGRYNMAIQEKIKISNELTAMKRHMDTHQHQLDQKDQEREEIVKGSQRYAVVLQENHEAEIRNLQADHSRAMKEKDHNHTEAISRMTATATDDREKKDAEHEAALKARDRTHTEEKSALIQAHNNEMSKRDIEIGEVEDEAEREKEALEARHTASLGRRDELHAAEKSQLEQQIEAAKQEAADAKDELFATQSEAANSLKILKEKHEADSEILKKGLSSEKSQLVTQQQERDKKLNATFQSRTLQLRQELKDLNEALLRRDEETYQGEIFSTRNLPIKPDEKIKDDFFQIKDLVDRLGRLSWKKDQKFWTPDIFQRFGRHGDQKGDQRKLRNAIVQDLIWTQLSYYVFCSPFRVFGEEGLVLENEWTEACGTNPASNSEMYNWPVPSVKAERWRYFTVKACRDVLSQQLSEQDQRARLKKGFKDTHSAFMSSLTTELASIIDLTEENQKTLSKLWKEAARIWLEFGKHRCRIVISLTGSESRSTKQKVALAQEGSLVLTELPMVGRHGNVKGIELESFTIIDSCAGIRYPESIASW